MAPPAKAESLPDAIRDDAPGTLHRRATVWRSLWYNPADPLTRWLSVELAYAGSSPLRGEFSAYRRFHDICRNRFRWEMRRHEFPVPEPSIGQFDAAVRSVATPKSKNAAHNQPYESRQHRRRSALRSLPWPTGAATSGISHTPEKECAGKSRWNCWDNASVASPATAGNDNRESIRHRPVAAIRRPHRKTAGSPLHRFPTWFLHTRSTLGSNETTARSSCYRNRGKIYPSHPKLNKPARNCALPVAVAALRADFPHRYCCPANPPRDTPTVPPLRPFCAPNTLPTH